MINGFPPKNSILGQYLSLAMLLAASFLLYYPVMGFGWISGLDEDIIIHNSLLNPLRGSGIADMFFGTTAGTYQPMSLISLALDMTLFPGTPTKGIHFINLMLHLLNILLFFRIVYMINGKVFISLFVAGLFAFHPLHLNAVAWMSSRGILLSSFFMLSLGRHSSMFFSLTPNLSNSSKGK